MITDRNLNIKEIIGVLMGEDSECELTVANATPFEMTAKDYLSFAKLNLMETSEKGSISAVSNAKIAVACRFDELLWVSSLKAFSSRERWRLAEKAEALRSLGILAPGILKKVTSNRNIMEHEYRKPPSRQEIRDLIDIAELFLKATESHLERAMVGAHISYVPPELKDEYRKCKEEAEVSGYILKRLETRKYWADYGVSLDIEEETITIEYSSPKVWLSEKKVNRLYVYDCGKENIIMLMLKLREKGYISSW